MLRHALLFPLSCTDCAQAGRIDALEYENTRGESSGSPQFFCQIRHLIVAKNIKTVYKYYLQIYGLTLPLLGV